MCKVFVSGFTFVLLVSMAACSDQIPWHGNFTFRINQRSYTFYKVLATWSEARDRCAAVGAKLFTPETNFEAIAVMWRVKYNITLTGAIWTGLNSLKDISDTYRDVDGRPFNSNADWAVGQPNSNGGTRRCVGLLSDFTLTVLPCQSAAAPFVCKVDPVPESFADIKPKVEYTELSDQIPLHGNFTFMINQRSYTFYKALATWSEARDRCAAVGAKLFTPETNFEAIAVMWRVKYNITLTGAIWTGLNSLKHSSDTYRDVDGRPFNSNADWAVGQPNSNGGTRRCVGLLSDFTLTVLPCQSAAAPFVCKVDPVPESFAASKPKVEHTELSEAALFEVLTKENVLPALNLLDSILHKMKKDKRTILP